MCLVGMQYGATRDGGAGATTYVIEGAITLAYPATGCMICVCCTGYK